MNITSESTYKGLGVSKSSKGIAGFYEDHLATIYKLLQQGSQAFTKPRAAHLIIDAPVDGALDALCRELERWAKGEGSTDTRPLYFACLETRPRNKQRHLHLIVIFQSTKDCTYSLKTLRNRLSKLAKNQQVTLARRRGENLPNYVDSETGEIKVNEFGKPRKMGSVYFHNLAIEFKDAFERFSYLAKVFSKDLQQIRGKTYSHSRISTAQNSSQQVDSLSEAFKSSSTFANNTTP